jgi:predicted permease
VPGLFSAFTDVLGPVLLIGAAGYFLARAHAVDARALTSLAANIMVPSLVFSALATSALPRATLVQLTAFVFAQFLLIGLVVGVAAWVRGWDRTQTTGFLLATLFSNAGNAGLPLALFAWGHEGLSAAAGFFAVSAVPTNMLAVFLAAQAGNSGRSTVRVLLRLPVTYAIAAGLGFNLLGTAPPLPIIKAAQLLASGAVAVMLLLVGAQLSAVRLEGEWRGIAFATAVRLVLAPVLAWWTAPLLGLEGVVRQTAILQASLPTAVTAAIWASEFGVAPGLVSSAVVVTSLLSPVTIAPLLVLLR